ncbi:signal recognition particle-docking protein FtsY [Clostridium sp. AF34-13]|nr:signal recognition particle-docking protein FtsY [Clostridium sp. AF34-13]
MWESIKNKFRRNKHIEEEQKIETENLQNEEATNSEAEAFLQSGETNANSDMESSLQSEKNIHSETESLQSGEVTQDKDKSQDVAVEASSEGSSSDDEAVHLETESLKIENDIHPETKNLSHDEVVKASNENNGSDNEAISSENNIPDNENVSNEAADNSQNVDDGEIKTAEESAKKPKKKGFFGKLIDGLTKTRDSFVSGLENVFSGFSEIDDDFYEELEEVLIMADIGVATTEKIIENLQAKVKENKIKEVAVCRQLLIDSIKEQMRVHDDAYDFENKKSVVMLIGVNGVGKTTSVGKLASQFKADGKKVILAAADTFRAAAIEQLTEWSNRAGVELIAGQEGGDPAAVVFDAVNAAKARNADILICDTAGRLHNKKNLMEELKKINRIVEREYPDAYRETFVVLDGTTGQNALAQAKQFSQVADITGIILTKLDGTAKGGIAIAIQSEMNIPVKYIGIGEHIEDLQKFDADAFVDALFETKAE